MRRLIDGIHRFHEQVFASECAFFEKLEQGQTPTALFITCSDSRVSPSLITQTRPGDLFVLRNTGNIIPPYSKRPSSAAATIEYAVKMLDVRDIIVCGHTACGAVQGVLEPEAVASMPAVAAWLDYAKGIRRIMHDHYHDQSAEDLLDIAVGENVLAQIGNLHTHPSVTEKVRAGELCLHAWVYDIAEGHVLAFNQDSGQYESVTAGAAPT